LLVQSGTTSIAAGLAVASGLLLDVAIAARFGAGTQSDAFFVGARVPLGLVAVVMVGANQALVPAISTWLVQRGRHETWRLTSLLLSSTCLLGLALAGVAAIAAWPLMRVTAPGIDADAVSVAASVARIMFFVVPLVAMAEVLRALLNALHSFFAPAAMNVVLNGLAAGIVITMGGHDPRILAWAYLAGATAQLVFLVVVALMRGFRFRATMDVKDPELAATGRLLVRPLAGASLNPLARVGEQLFVSFLPAGSLTILNYGYRLVSAIGGSVLFRSVMVVLLPRLTRASASRDDADVRYLTRLGVRIMLWISIPASVGMAILAKPAVIALFHRQNFSLDAARLLGAVLAVYAVSVVASGVQRAMLSPFFARLDTRTPLRNTVYGVVANLVLLPVMVLPFGFTDRRAVLGVAAAYSLAQYVNVAHAWYRLVHDLRIRMVGIVTAFLRLAIAAVVMAGVLLAGDALLDLGSTQGRLALLVRAAAVGIVGLLSFVAVGAALGFSDVREFLRRKDPVDNEGIDPDGG
jgi:murein biosynthesis integral membrane protein MurJ